MQIFSHSLPEPETKLNVTVKVFQTIDVGAVALVLEPIRPKFKNI